MEDSAITSTDGAPARLRLASSEVAEPAPGGGIGVPLVLEPISGTSAPAGSGAPAGNSSRAATRNGSRTAARWRRPRLGIPFAAIAGGLSLAKAHPDTERPIHEGDPRLEVKRRDAVFRRSLAVADLCAATAAVLLCVALIDGAGLKPLALIGLPLVIILGKLGGSYDRDELLVNKATVDEAPRMFGLATLFTLLFVVLAGHVVSTALGSGQIIVLWVTAFVFLLLARGLARSIARAVTPTERCLLVGTVASADRLRAKLAATGGNAVLVGRMSLGDGAGGEDVAGAAKALHRVVEELRVHRVVIEPAEGQPQAMLDFVREAKGTGTRVSLLPRILEVVGSSIEVEDVHGLTLLGVRRFGLTRSSAFVKRSFDLAGAAFALLALAPLLAALLVAIRLDSRGRAIYRQTRIGRDGKPFTMFKLRTMVDGADALKASLRVLNEAEGLFKIADDPRLTRVGRRLRRFSLDELPQLVNVLRGEMSLVGPRPLVADDDALIAGLDRRRLHLTPGMTGRWQILGSARVPLPEMIKLDYLYVTGWSLWSDVKILLRTVPYVLARRGM